MATVNYARMSGLQQYNL